MAALARTSGDLEASAASSAAAARASVQPATTAASAWSASTARKLSRPATDTWHALRDGAEPVASMKEAGPWVPGGRAIDRAAPAGGQAAPTSSRQQRRAHLARPLEQQRHHGIQLWVQGGAQRLGQVLWLVGGWWVRADGG